ncbi:MAG: hypothetical protein ACTSU7_03115 [Candidatus Heimdallarchaeaceae archaeon]
MSYKKLPIDSLEKRSSKYVSSYSCGNCGDTITFSHKEEPPSKPIICPNAFCGEREKFTLLKKE